VHRNSLALTLWIVSSVTSSLMAQEMPKFLVPGHEQDMQTLQELHALHHDRAFSNCTLWDGWLPQSTLWVSPKKREQYRTSLLNRRIDSEGYVSMQQHRGMAHSEGWPFPAWQQSTGIGFHFSNHKDGWAIQNFGLKPLSSIEGWEIEGAEVLGIHPEKGLQLVATSDEVHITTPPFRCGTIVAPFARIEWGASGLPQASTPNIQWQLEGELDWNSTRFVAFPPPDNTMGQQYANVAMHKHPAYAGLLTRYRLNVDHAMGAKIDLKSIITAIDTRHPITNSRFVRACIDQFHWTKDLEFLRANIGRMRNAVRYALDEFSVLQEKHVHVQWVGHNGRSGLAFGPDGNKTLKPGVGVGNNYWDLLPFGAHDAIATMYLFDTLQGMETLEREILKHPEWEVPLDSKPFDVGQLAQLCSEIQADFQQRFWNPTTGRFVGWIDVDGKAHDYGFTFVNLEAIHYGLASPAQARSILDWVDGKRTIEGDTSQGNDVYRWRFAPRATTRRNVETYVWVWSGPETIAWGDQVQDGGAVLGFSYFDLMARLKNNGPDDAWNRLREILSWFREVQAEGGYRPYYAKPGRGLLQGGGPPGGLGLDQEFLESVLVPQIMLYGFLGFEPHADGYSLNPKLPSGWPSLTLQGIRIHEQILDITAYPDGRTEVQPNAQNGNPP